MEKVKFRNLSWPLKTATVFAWIVGSLYIIGVIIGFISAYAI